MGSLDVMLFRSKALSQRVPWWPGTMENAGLYLEDKAEFGTEMWSLLELSRIEAKSNDMAEREQLARKMNILLTAIEGWVAIREAAEWSEEYWQSERIFAISDFVYELLLYPHLVQTGTIPIHDGVGKNGLLSKILREHMTELSKEEDAKQEAERQRQEELERQAALEEEQDRQQRWSPWRPEPEWV